MNVDQVMKDFRHNAQNLREAHNLPDPDVAAMLWDLNAWLRKRLNEETSGKWHAQCEP